MKTKTNKSLV